MGVIAVRAVHVTVIMLGVVAVGAVCVGVLVHMRLLRNEIAGNYLAITRHMHATTEQQTRFYLAFEAITDRFFRPFQ